MTLLLRFHRVILALLLLSGCAASPVTEKKMEVISEPVMKPAQKALTEPLMVEDLNLLSEGIALLGRPDRNDPARARLVFVSLIQRYPQSRWRSAAETLLRLIDEAEASLEKGRQDRLLLETAQTERTKALRENDQLKKTIRELTERYQAGTTVLTQENDQLKKDLQHLKALEIELQKRERMLR